MVMLEWWDERRVFKFPDLIQCEETVNLVAFGDTRLLCDWIEIDGVIGYLSRTTGKFVHVTEVGQRTFSTMLGEYSVEERLEARLKDDMTKKFLFYFMNRFTHVFVHDIYAQENTSNLEICGTKWATSTDNIVQNIALIKNKLLIFMQTKRDNVLTPKICFVDL